LLQALLLRSCSGTIRCRHIVTIRARAAHWVKARSASHARLLYSSLLSGQRRCCPLCKAAQAAEFRSVFCHALAQNCSSASGQWTLFHCQPCQWSVSGLAGQVSAAAGAVDCNRRSSHFRIHRWSACLHRHFRSFACGHPHCVTTCSVVCWQTKGTSPN